MKGKLILSPTDSETESSKTKYRNGANLDSKLPAKYGRLRLRLIIFNNKNRFYTVLLKILKYVIELNKE